MSTLPLFLVNYSSDPSALYSHPLYLADKNRFDNGTHVTYTHAAGQTGNAAIHAYSRDNTNSNIPLLKAGAVNYIRYRYSGKDTVAVESTEQLMHEVLPDKSVIIAGTQYDLSDKNNKSLPVVFGADCQYITIVELGLFERQTWDVLYQAYKAGYLPSPWFDSTHAPSRLLPD